MKNNFWTTSNIIVLSMGLMALPVGAAAGLYLYKKGNISDLVIFPEKKESAPEKLAIIDTRPEIEAIEEQAEENSIIAIIEEPVVEEKVEEVTEPKATSEPTSPADEHEHDHHSKEEKIAEIAEPKEEKPEVKTWDRFRDESQVKRLISRIDQAATESELNEHRGEIHWALESAEIVERIHNVTFNSANPHLDHRDETYLVSAMTNSAVMRKFGNHPKARLLVLGYASKDNDHRNKLFALNRAQSAEAAIHEHEEIIGFEGPTHSWCIGETDALSLETDEHCSQHNRAAEIWLIVSDAEVFSEIASDDFLKTHVRESSHGDSHHH